MWFLELLLLKQYVTCNKVMFITSATFLVVAALKLAFVDPFNDEYLLLTEYPIMVVNECFL